MLHSKNSNASDYIIMMSYLSLWASDDYLFPVTVKGSKDPVIEVSSFLLVGPSTPDVTKVGACLIGHTRNAPLSLNLNWTFATGNRKRKQSSTSPLTTSHNTTFQSVAELSSFLPVLFQLREVMRWMWWLHWREIPLVMKSQRAIRPSLQPATASIVPRLLNWVMRASDQL